MMHTLKENAKKCVEEEEGIQVTEAFFGDEKTEFVAYSNHMIRDDEDMAFSTLLW